MLFQLKIRDNMLTETILGILPLAILPASCNGSPASGTKPSCFLRQLCSYLILPEGQHCNFSSCSYQSVTTRYLHLDKDCRIRISRLSATLEVAHTQLRGRPTSQGSCPSREWYPGDVRL